MGHRSCVVGLVRFSGSARFRIALANQVKM